MTDLELLHAAGIEGSDATSQLKILSRTDDWSIASIGHYSQRAAAVMLKAGRKSVTTHD